MRGLCAILFCAAGVALAEGATAASEYIVKPGDTLWGIARRHKISYERLCALNNKPTDWSLIKVGQKIMVLPVLSRASEERLVSFGTPYAAELKDAKLLNEYGDFALFSGETEADAAFNAEPEREKDLSFRNSLLLRRRMTNGKFKWRLILTSGSDWKEADGMGEFGLGWVGDIRRCVGVMRASLSKDGRYIWMVCNPPSSYFYNVVCRFDLSENTLSVLIDGFSADEQPDGTIMVTGKKTYAFDENGEPLGARWYDLWMTPDGKIVRKGKLLSAEELEAEASDDAD